MQSLSGTGSLRVVSGYLQRNWEGDKLPEIWISDPTWGNHIPIFEHMGFTVKKYPYWDAEKKGLALEKMLDAMKNAPDNSVMLLHATAHNPTGVDPTLEQWKQISDAVMKKGHFCAFDMAYQGFASGSCEDDAA